MEKQSILYCLYGNSGNRISINDALIDLFAAYNIDFALLSDVNTNKLTCDLNIVVSKNKLNANSKWSAIVTTRKYKLTQFVAPRDNWCIATTRKNSVHICLIAVYFNVRDTRNEHESELEQLSEYVNLLHHDLIIIGGDFNVNTLTRCYTTISEFGHNRYSGAYMREWVSKNKYLSHSTYSTEKSFIPANSRIDHLIISGSSKKSIVNELSIRYGNFDHILFRSKIIVNAKQEKRYCLKTMINNNYNIHGPVTSTDSPVAIETSINEIESAYFTRSISPIREKIDKKNHELIIINSLLKELENKVRNNPRLINRMRPLNIERKAKIDEIRKEWIDKAKEEFSKNPWNGIKLIIGDSFKDNLPHMKHSNTKIISENTQKILSTFNNVTNPDLVYNEKFKIGTLSTKEVVAELKKIKSNSKTYPQGYVISNHEELCHQFTVIMNKCIEYGHFPRQWANGWLTLIPKKNSDKLRSIVTQNPLGFVLQRYIAKDLTSTISTLKTNSLASQYGFIDGKSLNQLLYNFHRAVKSEKRSKIAIIDMDIEGAFDNIDHSIIINILYRNNIPHGTISLIKSYLNNFTLTTLKDKNIIHKSLTKGVPQGSILGPHLWTILSSEILKNIHSIGEIRNFGKVFMYADDLKIIAMKRELIEDIITDVNIILSDVNLKLNKDKTKTCWFGEPEAIGSMTKTKEADIFGMKMGTASSTFNCTKKYILSAALDKAYGLSAHTEALRLMNSKATNIVIESCIINCFSHLWHVMTDAVGITKVWELYHKIEVLVTNSLFKRGKAPKDTLPCIYTNSITSRTTVSMIVNTCTRIKSYKDHRIFKDYPLMQTLVKNWYNRTGNRSEVSSKIIISRQFWHNALTLVTKINGNNREVLFTCSKRTNTIKVRCSKLCSNYDLPRIAIYRVMQWAAKLKHRELQIMIKDESFTKFGIPQLWHRSTGNIAVNIIVMDKTEMDRIKNAFENLEIKTTLNSMMVVGKRAIVKTAEDIVYKIAIRHWRLGKYNCSQNVTFNLITEINNAKTYTNKINALRLLCGYLKLPMGTICLCKGGKMVHYITECPQTRSIRIKLSPEMHTYLTNCNIQGKITATNNPQLTNQLINYLNQLFSKTIECNINTNKLFRM